MSNIDAGPLATYSSLTDPHLAGYFSNTKKKRHLRKMGLVTRRGDIVSESSFRVNMARKEHQVHVRDLLAQAIVHKTLDMERTRQVEIKRKLEEIAKIELVRRVKGKEPIWPEMVALLKDPKPPKRFPTRPCETEPSVEVVPGVVDPGVVDETERGRKGDEEVLPYLSPRPGTAASRGKRRPSSVPSGKKRSMARRPISAPSRGKSGGMATVYVDEDGYPIAPSHVKRGKKKKNTLYPTDDIDDRHLHALDQTALLEYYKVMSSVERGRTGPSPYTINPITGLDQKPPHPPKKSKSPSRSGKGGHGGGCQHRHGYMKGSLMLHRSEPAMKHQERVQTLCDVSMHYFGSNLQLDYEKLDPTDEVIIEQQHCGGNTLLVFKERILAHSDFTFTSRRHHGYPFSLTFYINGVLDCRLSTCCEYKHQRGARIGGRAGHFALIGVEGVQPCYKCQINDSMKNKKQKKRKEVVEEEDEDDGKDLEIAVETEVEVHGKEEDDDDKKEVIGLEDGEDAPTKKSMARIGSDCVVVVEKSSEMDTVPEEGNMSYDEGKLSEGEGDYEPLPWRQGSVRSDEEEGNYSDADFEKDDDDNKGSARSGDSDRSSRSSSSSRSSKSSRSSRSRSSSGSRSKSPASSRSSSPDNKKEKTKSKNKKSKAKEEKSATRKDKKKKEADKKQNTVSFAEDSPRKDSARDSDGSHLNSRRSSTSSVDSDRRPKTRMTKRSSMDENRPPTSMDHRGSSASENPPRPQTSMDRRESREKTADANSNSNSNGDDSNKELNTSKETSASTPRVESGGDTLDAMHDEMEKVLATAEDDKEDSSDERKDSPRSSSSSSSSSSESDSENEAAPPPKIIEPTRPSDTDDTGGITGTETDRAGGHDPDRVARPGTAQPSHLSLIGITPGAKHEGSLRPLVEDKKDIDLTSLALTDDQVEELASLLRKRDAVESLVLRNSNITNDGIEHIAAALKHTPATDLKMLNLNCNNINEDGMSHVVEILEEKKELEILLLHGSHLGDEGVRTLVSGLVRIHESGQVPEEQLAAIADATKNIVSDVIHHSLRDNRSRRTSLDILSAAINQNMTASGLRLTQLDIGDCHMTDEGAYQIASLISSNTPISNLSLTGNKGIGRDGWKAIANSLKVNKNLKTLSLDYNNLGDEGMSFFAETIQQNESLQSLDLEGNGISDVGAEKLLEGMQNNHGINDITLMPGNSIKETTLTGIKELLASRRK